MSLVDKPVAPGTRIGLIALRSAMERLLWHFAEIDLSRIHRIDR